MFIIDILTEHIAVKEATRLGIPIIALVDTNCDPDPISIVIPGNDDAIRSAQLFADSIAEACIAGRKRFESKSQAAAEGDDSPAEAPASSAPPAETPASPAAVPAEPAAGSAEPSADAPEQKTAEAAKTKETGASD